MPDFKPGSSNILIWDLKINEPESLKTSNKQLHPHLSKHSKMLEIHENNNDSIYQEAYTEKK